MTTQVPAIPQPYPWEKAWAECVRAKAEHPSYASGVRQAAWALKDYIADHRQVPSIPFLAGFISDCERAWARAVARGDTYAATLNQESADYARACLARWHGVDYCRTCGRTPPAGTHCPECAPVLTRRDPGFLPASALEAREPAPGTAREVWLQAEYERVIARMFTDLQCGGYGVPDEEHGGLSIDQIGEAFMAEVKQYERDLESRGCRFSSQERV